MVRQLDIEWMIPQHGKAFRGKAIIARFLNWLEDLPCGVDLFTQDDYQVI